MADRIAIGKKIRFEVFKRDSFTCQYCGESAPRVVLEIDHINPVSKGGDNDITNLITSCADCNSGKSNRELSDDAVIAKRKKQLDELQERREQIEMMAYWQRALVGLDDEATAKAVALWNELIPGYSINENGVRFIQQWIKRYDFTNVLESMRTSADTYLKTDEEGKLTQESVSKAFDYIPKICTNKKRFGDKPYLKELYYARGIMRNRFSYLNEWKAIEIMERAFKSGISTDDIKQVALETKNWTDWNTAMESLIAGTGGNNESEK
jgi:hypothetical protein